MLKRLSLVVLFPVSLFISNVQAQVDEDQLGAWYMYFWNTKLNNSNFGF